MSPQQRSSQPAACLAADTLSVDLGSWRGRPRVVGIRQGCKLAHHASDLSDDLQVSLAGWEVLLLLEDRVGDPNQPDAQYLDSVARVLSFELRANLACTGSPGFPR